MGKYDLTEFKNKIAPRKKELVEQEAPSRFNQADKALGIDEGSTPALPSKTLRVVRKTFSIPENEVGLINEIKDKALDWKLVLAESEVVRLGFMALLQLSSDELKNLATSLEKMPMGRPPKDSI